MSIEIIIVIALLIMSIVIHEVSHGYMANFLGDPTARLQGRLTLNPIKHIDPFGSVILPIILALLPGSFLFGWAKPVPYNPYNLRSERWGEALVAFAGPAVNILIAVIVGLGIRYGFGSLSPSLIDIASYVVLMNLVLALFNLIPIPPLDGSKVLFAFLPQNLQSIRFQLEQYGFFLVLLFVFTFWGIIAPLVFTLFSLITGLPLI